MSTHIHLIVNIKAKVNSNYQVCELGNEVGDLHFQTIPKL